MGPGRRPPQRTRMAVRCRPIRARVRGSLARPRVWRRATRARRAAAPRAVRHAMPTCRGCPRTREPPGERGSEDDDQDDRDDARLQGQPQGLLNGLGAEGGGNLRGWVPPTRRDGEGEDQEHERAGCGRDAARACHGRTGWKPWEDRMAVPVRFGRGAAMRWPDPERAPR